MNVVIINYAYQILTFLKNQWRLRYYMTNSSNHHAKKKIYLGQEAIFS